MNIVLTQEYVLPDNACNSQHVWPLHLAATVNEEPSYIFLFDADPLIPGKYRFAKVASYTEWREIPSAEETHGSQYLDNVLMLDCRSKDERDLLLAIIETNVAILEADIDAAAESDATTYSSPPDDWSW
jgi:hypothetical protein